MGFDARFTAVLFGWLIALLLAAAAFAWAIVIPDLAAVRLIALLLVIGASAGLVHHIGRTNQAVARFVGALDHGDLSARFSTRGGTGFAALGESFNRALRRLQRDRDRMAEEYRFLEGLIDDVPVAVLTVDQQQGVTLVNKAARRLFATVSGNRPTDFTIYGETFAAHLADPDAPAAELLLLRSRGGPQRAIVRHATLERLGLRTRAITVEPVQGTLDALEMVAQTDLVRVLTHEILNSLTPVTSLAATAATLLAADSPDLGLARTATETLARRAEGLSYFIRSYRAVAHVPEPRLRQVYAEPLVRDLERLFAADWPAFTLVSQVTPGLVFEADPDLLTQALINLLRNAAQATADDDCRSIVLSVIGDAAGVRITVADRGPGIPENLRRDIFLPFFTTRSQGTGVGLNLVRQIVIAHGWTMDVADAAIGGAEFRIYVSRSG